jgi:hypothetical protein
MHCKRAELYKQLYAQSLAIVSKLQAETRSRDDISEEDRYTELISAHETMHKKLTHIEHGTIFKAHVRDCKRCRRIPDMLTKLRGLFPELFDNQ